MEKRIHSRSEDYSDILVEGLILVSTAYAFTEMAQALKNLEPDNKNLTGKLDPSVSKKYENSLRELVDKLKILGTEFDIDDIPPEVVKSAVRIFRRINKQFTWQEADPEEFRLYKKLFLTLSRNFTYAAELKGF